LASKIQFYLKAGQRLKAGQNPVVMCEVLLKEPDSVILLCSQLCHKISHELLCCTLFALPSISCPFIPPHHLILAPVQWICPVLPSHPYPFSPL